MNKKEQNCSQGRDTPPASKKIPLLEQREIQAPLAVSLIKGFAEVIGHERALEVATTAIQADAQMAGRKMAERFGGNSLKELSMVVREIWAEDDAISITILKETERELHFDVNRCRYAELYETMGIREYGVCLSCSRDGSFARGFNPRIMLHRQQTIMEGAPLCDFRFTLDK